MAKRTATTDLNHDNWDQEGKKEAAGTFTPLDQVDLRNRIIKKAKRSLDTISSGSSPLKGISPFAKFSGFSSTAPSTFPSLSTNSLEKVTPFSAPFLKIGEMKSVPVPAIDSTSEVDKEKTRNIEYYRQLQSLNESVLKWMQLHLEKNKCCDFTPVFNDYKKHLDTLNVTYPIANKQIYFKKDATKSTSVSKDGQLTSKSPNTTDTTANSKTNNGNTEDETDYGAHFKSNTTNTSTFSFGIQLSATATSSGSPMGPTSSSKENAIGQKKDSSQISFSYFKEKPASTDNPCSFAVAPTEKPSESGDTNENAEDVPPKNDFVAVQETDALYSKRCKLFFKKDEGYTDKGVGTLYLKFLEGKTQLLVRADTNLGNILLNIMLNASLPMSRTGKNYVLLVCIPNPPVDPKNSDSKEPIPILIRVKTAEDADELLEAMNKYKS